MAIATSDILIARNPATGAELGRVPTTSPEAVAEAVARARRAQADWGEVAWRQRRRVLRRWWGVLARAADALAGTLSQEAGKPSAEALAEVVSTLDGLRWTVRHTGRALADERIGRGWQRWMLMPAAWLRWRPLGVVGMIGTWNYPLFLNVPAIAQALAAGNAVVWKPSEWGVLVGRQIELSLEEAGIPDGLVATVYGGPDVGAALIGSDLDKGMFTGGIDNGRRILGELGRRGIPALAELSGFDPAIVLPDAPRESTVRALAWSAFVGSGQTCVAVKRVYVVGDATPWAVALAERARGLRLGDPGAGEVDLGPMISEAARDRFDRTIRETIAAGARVLAGGALLSGPGWFYAPTVLAAETAAAEAVLAGCFGPVVLVRGVDSPEAAVAAANTSPYGLSASVWGRDRRAARAVAARLQAGMVGVNEAVVIAAHAAAPFGGTKASGFGRTHGVLGLREFAQPQALLARGPGGFRPQLFPYSDRLARPLAVYRWLFHPRR